MMQTRFAVVSLCILCAVTGVTSDDIATELRLIDNLMMRYNKEIRPAARDQPVELHFQLQLVTLHALNFEKQSLELHAWTTMEWKDISLQWDPAEYDGIDKVRVSNTAVWLPDIKLYNSIETEHGVMDAKVVISSDGTVMYVPRVTLHAHCNFDRDEAGQILDTQLCGLKFGSWVYSGDLVHLAHDMETDGVIGVEMSSFTPHPEWSIIHANGTKNTIYYVCCPEPYEDITYSIYMKRNKKNVPHNTQEVKEDVSASPSGPLPVNEALVAASLVLLIPVLFLLPPESREKMTLGVGVLITLGVLRHLAARPKFALFMDISLLLVSISIVCSTLVLNMWYNSSLSSKISSGLHQLAFGLAAFCCLGNHSAKSEGAEAMNLNTVEGNGKTGPRSFGEWQVSAKVIDRVLCVLFFIVTIVCCIGALG